MAEFKWTELYSVGDEEIDEQHRLLFDIANHFNEACEKNLGPEILGKIFQELIEYTATHFADEERMLKEINYPDYYAHKQNHDKLVKLVMDYKKKFDAGEGDAAQQAMHFIKTWLNGHILGMDRGYRSYLGNRQP